MIVQQNTPEWLEFRKTKIGASDAPIIMGVSPWKTPYQLWQEKLGLVEEKEPNVYMNRGKELESIARLDLALQRGIHVTPEVLVSKQYPWMIASLDGIDDTGKIVVEIKCPGREDHTTAVNGGIPDKYYPQLQHQMLVADVDKVLYVSYDGGALITIWVGRDDLYIDKMIEAEKKFYECLTSRKAPDFTEKDYVTRNDDLWKEAARRWRAAKKSLELAETEEKIYREHLLVMAGEKNTEGCDLRVTKIVKKGNIEYDKIPELSKVDVEKYRKKSVEYWRISDEQGR